MNTSIEYLLSFLKDEFEGCADVRVSLLPKAGVRRSVDLPQNYDPQTRDLHLREGVVVKAGGREYYFPSSWIVRNQFSEVQRQILEIREFAGLT